MQEVSMHLQALLDPLQWLWCQDLCQQRWHRLQQLDFQEKILDILVIACLDLLLVDMHSITICCRLWCSRKYPTTRALHHQAWDDLSLRIQMAQCRSLITVISYPHHWFDKWTSLECPRKNPKIGSIHPAYQTLVCTLSIVYHRCRSPKDSSLTFNLTLHRW